MIKIPMLKSQYIYKEILLNNFFRHFRKYSIKLKLTLQSLNWRILRMLSSKRYLKEKTTLASRYHRAISCDVIYNNKRKRLRDICGILPSERISNRMTLAPKEILSSVVGTRSRDESVHECLHVACTRSRVMSSRISGLTREVRMRLWAW